MNKQAENDAQVKKDATIDKGAFIGIPTVLCGGIELLLWVIDVAASLHISGLTYLIVLIVVFPLSCIIGILAAASNDHERRIALLEEKISQQE